MAIQDILIVLLGDGRRGNESRNEGCKEQLQSWMKGVLHNVVIIDSKAALHKRKYGRGPVRIEKKERFIRLRSVILKYINGQSVFRLSKSYKVGIYFC